MKLLLYTNIAIFIALSANKIYPATTGVSSDTNYNKLYENTANLIYDFYKNQCCSGFLDDSIAKNIYYIVFDSPDSLISVKRKIDLLVLMRQYHHFATNVFGDIIRREFLEQDSINSKDLLFILPFATCYYCKVESLNKFCKLVQINDTSIFLKYVPTITRYIFFYTTIINDIKSICEGKSNRDPPGYTSNLPNLMIINSKEFINEFPMFFK